MNVNLCPEASGVRERFEFVRSIVPIEGFAWVQSDWESSP